MWGTAEPDLPDGARSVMVLAPAGGGGECAALAARADRVLLVGYGTLTAERLRDRLADRADDPPPVRALGVGETVEPRDLTGQGIGVAEKLSPGTAVCVDGLGPLIRRVGREPVFQFVHTLAERCAQSSAAMHYHLDPETVDERAVAALSTLMDAVVDVAEESVTVRPELTETG